MSKPKTKPVTYKARGSQLGELLLLGHCANEMADNMDELAQMAVRMRRLAKRMLELRQSIKGEIP